MDIYQELGVDPIINAVGPATRLSGSIMHPEVAEAMRQASERCVDIAQMQARAGEIIAEITGAEAGYVTSGAAAGLLLGTAACVTGLDPGKMNRLPDTSGMKNEVIMARSHRNFYDHAVRSVGIELVEVGIADRFSGAGVRDAEGWRLRRRSASGRRRSCTWRTRIRSRRWRRWWPQRGRAGVPVIVDAAGQLPPASNLQRFIAAGADLVAFSGGKTIGGPQASGILCGRRDLIASAALQHQDLDVMPELWDPPASLIDKSQLPGAPQHGIGRPCKVGKEEIAGLVKALRLFVAEDPAVRRQRWYALMEGLVSACGVLRHAEIEVAADRKRVEIPTARLVLDEEGAGMTALELVKALQEGRPQIAANPTDVYEGAVIFGPMCLKEGEP